MPSNAEIEVLAADATFTLENLLRYPVIQEYIFVAAVVVVGSAFGGLLVLKDRINAKRSEAKKQDYQVMHPEPTGHFESSDFIETHNQ